MTKMSNKMKEEIAVHAIKNARFAEGSNLDIDIPTGDKKPSFDGQITVFEDNSEQKDSYINDVPTQVKGTEVKEFTVNNRTFSLDLSHYNNFYKRGGCLFLVVEILNPTTTKIFYKQLLPTELKHIIETRKHQKSYSVSLRPLDETTLYIVCRKFLNEVKKQPHVLLENKTFNEEDFDKLLFTSLTFNPQKESIQDIVNHDFFLYGIKDNIQYPIRNMKPDAIAIADYEEVKIGEREFRFKVESRYIKPTRIKIIEDCLEFIFNDSDKKFNFNIKSIDNLSKQLKILPFLIEFLKAGKIEFNDRSYREIKNDDENTQQHLEKIENTYSLFLGLKEVFNLLNVDEDTPFGKSENIITQIQSLVNTMQNNDYSAFKEHKPEMPTFFNYMIGDIYLLLFYNPKSENKVINAFSQELIDMPFTVSNVEDGEGKRARLSPYLMLQEEVLIKADNLNIDMIIKSLDYIDYDKPKITFPQINQFSLACVNAYDITKNKDLLRIPIYLYNKLNEEVPLESSTKEIINVNLLQAIYRKENKLNDEDYKQLLTLKKTASVNQNEELLFCVNVLLESKREASFIFNEFDEKNKELYMSLPIYYLYKKM
ncbi:hypothetical protein JUJ52_17705 [Virgibacillus sp. AGTR]|uniref:hypothetical protein n=1 Tax=Virgibacillus sp. AGTR TaxID=2812055 RepID=UPI001D163B38|nr:hypothetical protein [Virgibacillus sp. AGTR]MCC2251786.1 hypothetical protein [Virgibacillus sp. AGTR]